MKLKSSYQVGQEVLKNYKITKAKEIPALQSVLYEVEHMPSGAQIMHIANTEKENLFCLNFMTLPTSNNGVPHILEHTVLCGSEKFPVKDPFFYMTRRSLNTFMNALTGSDFTCYPAASQVEKDFYNLLEVYLDAVFHPLLNRLSFLQEGHRLEYKELNNPNSELTYQGIVYNEMKGALSSADSRLWHTVSKHLMKDLPYRFNSGGDPKEIPDLTYEEFLDFHKTYYHPSRCLFFFYGDLPLEKHLTFLENKILCSATKAPKLPPLPKQKRFEKPIHISASYPTTEEDLSHKTLIAFSWLTAEVQNQDDVLALQLLDSILMDTDASPLKREILRSELCRTCDAFIDIEMSEVPFGIICRGTEEKHAKELEKIVFNKLEAIAKEGIDQKLIDSSLHQLEFSRLEISGDYGPFGLNLFFRAGLSQMHGCPAENGLVVQELFDRLLEQLKNPNYLTDILKKYLLDNKHFLTLVMTPDPQLGEEEAKQEREALKKIEESLSQKEKETIVKESQELLEFQKAQKLEKIETLPKIHIEDVPKKNTEYPLRVINLDNLDVFHHECFTNHIVYVDIVMDLPKLTQEELHYTRLFAYLATEVGVKDLSYIEQQKRIHFETGGVGFSCATHNTFSSPDEMKPALHLKGKALSRKTDALFALLKDLMTSIRFDEKERIKEVIYQLYTHMQNRLSKNSMSYAIDLALSSNSDTTKLHHLWHGIPYYKFIEDITKNIETKLDNVIEYMKSLQDKLLHNHNLNLILSCDENDFEKIKKHNFYNLQDLEKKPYEPWLFNYTIEKYTSHARIIPSPVAFTCQGFKTIYAPHEDIAALSIASCIFDHKTLHKKIREAGGAYGAGSFFNMISGNFYMYSYRDPNLKSTLKAFEEAIQHTAEGIFDDNDLEEAKLTIIQSLDSPVSPGSRASVAFSQRRENRTPSFRQKLRDQILTTCAEDVKKAVKKHLSNFSQEAQIITFSGKDLITRENEKLDNKLPILEI